MYNEPMKPSRLLPLLSLLVITLPIYFVFADENNTGTPSSDASAKIDSAAQNQTDIAAKEEEINQLNQKIKDLQNQTATTAGEAELITSQIARIQTSLDKAQLELKKTKLNITTTKTASIKTQDEINQLNETIAARKKELRYLLRMLYTKEQSSLVAIFLDTGSFSQVLAENAALQTLQDRGIEVVRELRQQTQALQARQSQLEQQITDLSELQQMQAVQQADLDNQQREQEKFLQAKKAEQAAYEQKIAEAVQARKEIEQDMFTLKNAGVQLSLTEATDMAKYAGKLTGVRPALLLGVLKVETNLGANIGSGKFPDDMHPASREPFLRITKKLGLDPNTAPISARPKSFSGWGGAMGPAQFMPQTWEGIEGRLSQLMQKPQPNPYELTDAFVATAILLADRGASSQAGEYEAVNRYLAGPNWQNFTWYGDRVLAVAAEYAKEGL
ncbi:MAG: hypothetical protein U1C49_01255 [Candidatus Andersenbacteria bacterium]|nr:hypothetical protein [bacterium]MDZ4225453.1 hypothetical protein [Candidatus Andersenbacteria bacterium]